MPYPAADMTPNQKWEALKKRGNPTVQEIEEIDRETPWSDLGEPEWWLEMMNVHTQLLTENEDGQSFQFRLLSTRLDPPACYSLFTK